MFKLVGAIICLSALAGSLYAHPNVKWNANKLDEAVIFAKYGFLNDIRDGFCK